MPHVLSTQPIRDYYDDWTGHSLESCGDVFQACRPEDTDALIDSVIDSAGSVPGMRISDAGCGVAGPSVRIAKKVAVTIDAITVAQVQADVARRRVAEAECRLFVRPPADLAAAFASAGCPQVFDRPIGFTNTPTMWQLFANANQIDLSAGGQPLEWTQWRHCAYRIAPNSGC